MPCGHPASPDPESSDGTGRSPPDADLGLRFFSVRGLFERDSASSPRPLREPEDRVGVVDRPGPEFPEQPPLCEGRPWGSYSSKTPLAAGNCCTPSQDPFSFIPVHVTPICSAALLIAPRGQLHAGPCALLCRSWCCSHCLSRNGYRRSHIIHGTQPPTTTAPQTLRDESRRSGHL